MKAFLISTLWLFLEYLLVGLWCGSCVVAYCVGRWAAGGMGPAEVNALESPTWDMYAVVIVAVFVFMVLKYIWKEFRR